MRRFLAIFVVILVVAVTGVAHAGLQLDFSKSDSEVLDTQTLRIKHISNAVLDGVPIAGEWWIDFVWDQQNWIFAPNGNVGQEQGGLSKDNWTGTWSGSTVDFEGLTRSLTLTLDTNLSGSLVVTDQGVLDISGSVSNDTLSFNLPLAVKDVGDPDCVNWGVNCNATLSQDSLLMFMSCSGNFCNSHGKITGFSASLNKQ